MKPVAPKVATTIVVGQRKGSMVPLVSEFISKHTSGAKSGSTFETFVAMNNENLDYAAKVVPRHTPYSTATNSSTEKMKSAPRGQL